MKVMEKISCGLFILTARTGGRDNGCVVNTVMQVTAAPNRIAVAVNKQNCTHDMMLETKEFNVSVLDEASQFSTFKNFGFQSGRDADKFAAISFARSANGLAYLTQECNGYISARIVETVDVGTHTLFIAEVTDGAVLSGRPSATYSFYHEHIKPAAAPAQKKGFICVICGYIYEGDVLPPDFICPICKHPASDFRPL